MSTPPKRIGSGASPGLRPKKHFGNGSLDGAAKTAAFRPLRTVYRISHLGRFNGQQLFRELATVGFPYRGKIPIASPPARLTGKVLLRASTHVRSKFVWTPC